MAAETPGDAELMHHLTETGQAVELGGGVTAAMDVYEGIVRSIVAHARQQPSITVAEVRDLLSTSRRNAMALLEHLDAERITLRRGDERVLGPRAAAYE
jgi:selenocysteine-specific elongation factor